jgi:hypothetical protein
MQKAVKQMPAGGNLWWQYAGYPELCPAYDLLSSAAHPNLYITIVLSRSQSLPSNLRTLGIASLEQHRVPCCMYHSLKKILFPWKIRKGWVLSFPPRLQNRLHKAQLEKGWKLSKSKSS